jgi:hypothetical protein
MLTPASLQGRNNRHLWDSDRLISLLEVLEAYANWFAETCSILTDLEWQLDVHPNADISLDTEQTDIPLRIVETLKAAQAFSKGLDLDEVDRQIERLYLMWEGAHREIDLPELRNRLRVIRETIYDHLRRRKLFYVKRPEFYETGDLFGPDVASRFCHAKDDIIEAGRCLALGRGTSTVFHCMRVAETGLQALAKDLIVMLKNDRPIEYEDWTNILHAIDDKIEKLRHPKTKENQESIQFYSEAAAQFRYFKDAWRNHVSHARENYDLLQAESILSHVREFMQDLAKRLKETQE